MPTIYTIGFHKKSLETFITLVRPVCDAVIDVRLLNTSQLAGYTKRDDLAFLLREGFGVAYEHRADLAPTEEVLTAYRQDGDWEAYEVRFLPLLAERAATDVGREILARYRAPCLLCAEPTADRCHRRLVAECWAREIPEACVVHL